MANLTDLPEGKQWAAIAGMAVLLTLAAYFGVFRSMSTANDADAQKLQREMAENAELERYRPKLVQIEQQIENLKLQLAIQERIVPDEKEADKFMRMMQGEADKSGVEIRRYTALPTSTREFYTEVPFQIELDGPYYSLVNFFERVGHLERIINISNLLMATVKKPMDAGAKSMYAYAPGESVVATCTATTFFSHDQPAAQAKPGVRPVAVRR
jgi:type IV pilus assembly protein PilO